MSNRRLSVSLVLALLMTVAPVTQNPTYSAPGLDNRSITIGNSNPSAVTTYDFQFDITLATNLGSIQFEFCSNSPIPSTPCTVPSGFDITSANLVSQTGETGFSIGASTTANNLLLTRIPAVATPQTVNYDFTNVTNPDTGPATYYIRVLTFASTDGTGPNIEEAGLAFAMSSGLAVSAYVPPFLLFCVGVFISGNDCDTATGNLIDLGIISTSTANVATSQFNGGTNGVGGYAVTILGNTMTSGVNFIPELSIRGPSSPGASQFGINLRNNSSPNVGANPSGPGTIAPIGDYNVPNEFVFRTGDVIANSTLPTDFSTVTVSYLVNANPNQKPGVYTSTLTYVATATF